jgi:hypothetical protein
VNQDENLPDHRWAGGATIDSLPMRLPAGAHATAGWGFHMHISTFYQQIIAQADKKA